MKRGDKSRLFCRHASGVVDDKQNIKLATAEGLAAPRDALLPKLLSGELRVAEAVG